MKSEKLRLRGKPLRKQVWPSCCFYSSLVCSISSASHPITADGLHSQSQLWTWTYGSHPLHLFTGMARPLSLAYTASPSPPISVDHFPISTPMCYNVSHLKQTLFRLCPGKLCWLFLFAPFYHKHLSKDMSTPAFSQFSQLLLDPLKWSLCFAILLKALDEVNDLYVTKSNCEFPVFIFSDPAAAFDTVHYSSFFYKTLFSLGFLYFFGCNFLVLFANSRFLLWDP